MNKDFARGMIVSMALKALPVRKKSPIAYLYNGVRLPALPEWDREKYPYAYISNGFLGIGRAIYFFKTIEYGINKNGSYALIIPAETGMMASFSNNQWGEPTLLAEESGITVPNDSWIWANFDVLNSDGSVYLAASKPIPVYE